MKQNTVRTAVVTVAIVVALAVASLAQVPTRTKIRFTITVPYSLTVGGYTLPAGHYILFEDSQNASLFRLYENDMAREPLATIYTVRGRYGPALSRHGDAELALVIDESSSDLHPVLKGFGVPFADPWQIVSVATKRPQR